MYGRQYDNSHCHLCVLCDRAVLDHVSSRIVQSGATGQGGDNKLNDAILGHVTSIQNDLRTLANKVCIT